jgi:O-antigen/teichoic acid export membrane protein
LSFLTVFFRKPYPVKFGVSRAHSVYVFGQLSLTGSTFIFNIIIAGLLGPGSMGIWQTAVLVSTYGMMLMFGALNGMGREVPFLRGRQDDQGVNETISSALALLIVVSALLATISLSIELSGLAPAWLMLGAGLLFARLANSFSMMLIRSLQDFARLGLHQGVTAGLLLLGIAWVWQTPSLHRVLAVMAIALLSVTLLAARYVHPTRPAWSRLRQLVSVGLPIMLAGVIFGLLTTVDRLLILGFLGTESLGLYTPAISALGIITIAPSLISNVMYPKLAHEFGRTENLETLLPFVKRMLQLNFAVTIVITLVFLVTFYTFIIPFVLPAYMDGRQPMAILLVSALFLPIGQSFGDLFNVIGWQRHYLINMTIGFLASAIIGYILVGPAGMGLSGVAVGTVIGTAIFATLQTITFIRLQRQKTV